MTEPESKTLDLAPPPPQVGAWRIEKELGAGGMGAVYLAKHVETGQSAAVKILPASLSREPGFVARFAREVDAMRQLKSPHIVELYDSGEDRGIYFYAMEYVPGETLTDRLKRDKRLPWREAIEIGVQVCRALKAAHNTGIVHRDLKPSNLLLHEDGTVKLTDFGIAQIFATGKLTVTGGILGTAEYMSPEQAQGKRAVKQSDIYSLGAVLYVMLTGRPPFTGKTTLEILQKHRYGQFDSPKRVVPEIPFWLDETVCKCLSKKPEERYPDAYVLMLRLQEIPKKLDVRQGGELDASADPNTETMAASSAGPHAVGGALGGTLVRELFRAEIEGAHHASLWDRLFDNVWALAGLLLLLMAGGFALAKWNHLSPEQKFARGQKLMAQPEGDAWETARRQYFDPLLLQDEDKWAPQIEPYLAQIQLYELKRQLLGPAPQSEPEAILRQALELRKLGRVSEARDKLLALETLLRGNDELKPLAAMTARLREEITERAPPDRLGFVRDALRRADELHAAGKTADARGIWRSIAELYDADPDARDLVVKCRKQLAATQASASSSIPNPPSSPAPSESPP